MIRMGCTKGFPGVTRKILPVMVFDLLYLIIHIFDLCDFLSLCFIFKLKSFNVNRTSQNR